jgi:hypothetical protein
MKNFLLLLLLLTLKNFSQAQTFWSPLPSLPTSVTNNAITSAQIGGKDFVYSFAGLDSTKIWSGIHLNAWRYDVQQQLWETLPPVPDAIGGKIAASASTVKNKIYVIGGYHVTQNGAETSSNRVHRFDPESNIWMSDGTNIPVPIDDQVQSVWRDSLIYVITGWSNTGNIPLVQIYNPTDNQWLVGTPVPNTNSYKAFGASGVIVGDTIYYCGGATTAANFPAATNFRKGIINPQNPKQITWSQISTPLAKGYRMAATLMNEFPIWIGGSAVTYNYDGIAYNGSGGVSPQNRIVFYNRYGAYLEEIVGEIPPTMDLRGAAQLSDGSVIVVGGMTENQAVTNRVWLLNFDILIKNKDILTEKPLFYPNPASDVVHLQIDAVEEIQVLDALGRVHLEQKGFGLKEISLRNLTVGSYFLEIKTRDGRIKKGIVVKNE